MELEGKGELYCVRVVNQLASAILVASWARDLASPLPSPLANCFRGALCRCGEGMLPFGYTVFLQSPLSLTVLSDNIYIYICFCFCFCCCCCSFFVYTTCETHFCVCAFFFGFVLFCFLLYPLHFIPGKKKKKKN